MNWRHLCALAAGVLLVCPAAEAQNETDILRYSMLEPLGSTRLMGMNGAMTALGADLSCAGLNPAGIGAYRRGDAAITAGLGSRKTKATFNAMSNAESDLGGTVALAGIALTVPSIHPDWPFATIGLVHQKRQTYHEQVELEGMELEGSLGELFQQQAQGTPQNDLGANFPFTAGPAWQAYLLDPDPLLGETNYVTAMGNGGASGSKRLERSGTMSDFNITAAAAFRDVAYGGVSIGLVAVEYAELARHTESPLADSLDLIQWHYTEALSIEGNGINLKAGAIWNATSWLRLGASYHSRTRIVLSETYDTSVSTTFIDGVFSESSPVNNFDYVIVTPSRWTLGAAFVMGKWAVITADYEQVNYASGELRPKTTFGSSDEVDFSAANEAAATLYTVSHQARVGFEARVAKDWRLRLGAGQATTPWSQAAEVNADATRWSASGGFAFRRNDFHAGISYRRTWTEGQFYLMDPALVDTPVQTSTSQGVVQLSIGKRL